MNGKESEDGKQSTADMTAFVQNLLQQMQSRFHTMSESIVSKHELEQSINDLKTEMGVETTPSPTSKGKSEETKQAEGST